MASQRTASPTSTSSSPTSPDNYTSELTAVVKGAGPSGLASAIALAQNGFKVRVVEKRLERPEGQGRQNMVAVRPEALRRLDQLGALPHLLRSRDEHGNSEKITRMTFGETKNAFDGNVLKWEFKRYPPAEPENLRPEDEQPYEVPESLALQFPSSFVTLGNLEDALRQAATKLGVEVTYDATITLTLNEEKESYSVTLTQGSRSPVDLGIPTLVVLASGKNDFMIQDQLSFTRRVGVVLESSNLPESTSSENARALKLSENADHELESQLFSFFGVKLASNTPTVGSIDHDVLKHKMNSTAKTFQPVIEITMNDSRASHLLLHLPRSKQSLEPNSAELEEYILSRMNARLAPESPFTSIQQLKESGVITWGEPLQPVVVETSTAPQYAYGSNVVLVGDAAISCSPSSGIGADIGMTGDSKSVEILGASLANASKERNGKADVKDTMRLLDEYNSRKAQSAVLWSQASRIFYMTQQQADQVVQRVEKEELQARHRGEKAATVAA